MIVFLGIGAQDRLCRLGNRAVDVGEEIGQVLDHIENRHSFLSGEAYDNVVAQQDKDQFVQMGNVGGEASPKALPHIAEIRFERQQAKCVFPASDAYDLNHRRQRHTGEGRDTRTGSAHPQEKDQHNIQDDVGNVAHRCRDTGLALHIGIPHVVSQAVR